MGGGAGSRRCSRRKKQQQRLPGKTLTSVGESASSSTTEVIDTLLQLQLRQAGNIRLDTQLARLPNRSRRIEAGTTGRRVVSVCRSVLEGPVYVAMHHLRLARKVRMRRMEYPGIATEAQGCVYTGSLE